MDDWNGEVTVHGIRGAPRKTAVTGSLRTGYWAKITIFRFYDYRKAAEFGPVAVGQHSSQLIESVDDILSDAVAMPLYRSSASSSTATMVSGVGEHAATRVHAFSVKDISPLELGGKDRQELIGSVTRLTTQKSLAQASGRFSIVAKVDAEWINKHEIAHDALAPLGEDNDIYKYVDSGDWVEINSVRSDPRNPDVLERSLMVGKVDSVTLSINPPLQGGVTLTIEGRDVGSVLEDTPLYFNPYDPTHNNPLGIEMTTLVNQLTGSPDEIVLEILGLSENPAATFGVPPVLPNGGLWSADEAQTSTFADVWDTGQVQSMRGLVHQPSLLSPGQYTPLWNFTQTYGVPAMNEWYVDILPTEIGPNNNNGEEARFIYIFGREKPFVNAFEGEDSNWFRLPYTIVHVQEIKAISVSKSGAERYNHINVLAELPSNITSDIVAYCTPAVNYHSVVRWGLKKLDVTVALHAQEDDEDLGQFYIEVKQWRDLMICWNVLNPYYWQGTITLHGLRADIRVGQKILLEGGPVPHMRNGPITATGEGYRPISGWDEQTGEKIDDTPGGATTFYVEGVSYTWGAGVNPVATTTLQVTRGYVEAKRVADVKALYKLWENATDAKSSQIPQAEPLSSIYEPGSDLFGDGVLV